MTPTTDLIEMGKRVASETGHYSGGNARDFDKVGRHTLQTLVADGLLPSHRVLDFGCGSLRNGYWLIRFLDSGNYYGIEPVEKSVRAGLKHLIGPELEEFKKPQFLFNRENNIGAFGVPFDYAVARSILSHTCPGMLHRILESFVNSSPNGTFFASYWRHDIPATPPWWRRRQRRSPEITRYKNMAVNTGGMKETDVFAVGDELPDDDMRFIQIITYSLSRIQEIAGQYGLSAEEDWTFAPINQQIWLKFTGR
jgi:SAM-dependent methyltransferase